MAGVGWATVNVKLWAAGEPMPFDAVNTMLNTSLTTAVPLSVAVPLLLSTNDTGIDPVSVMVGRGSPVVVTVNEPATPTVNVALFALVINGA
jgi:hypothetical protein